MACQQFTRFVPLVLFSAQLGGACLHAAEPLANLAAFARVSTVSTHPPFQRLNAPKVAEGDTNPVVLSPDQSLEMEWDEPRDVSRIRLHLADATGISTPLLVEWWHRVWPDNGEGGWMRLDDPFNGEWIAARGSREANGREISFHFAPLAPNEVAGIKNTGAPFRHTYKIRLSASAPVGVKRIEINSDAIERQATLRFEWNVKSKLPGKEEPRFEARNGKIIRSTNSSKNSALVTLGYADATNCLSADRGYVVFRAGETNSFSVFVDDVLREGGLFVRDIGVFVSDASRNLTFNTWSGPDGGVWRGGTVMEQVARLPEQTFESATRAMPVKPPPQIFLGVPNLRQEIALGPKGEIQLFADSLRSDGPDIARRPWKWPGLQYRFRSGDKPSFSTPDPRQIVRHLEDGWLPVVRHDWSEGPLEYAQTAFAVPLTNDLATLNSTNGVEPVALVTRFEIKNTSAVARTAWLWLSLDHMQPLWLAVDGTLVLHRASDDAGHPDLIPVRGRFDTHGKGELDIAILPTGENPPPPPETSQEAVRYKIELGAGESHPVDFAATYVELLDKTGLQALKHLSYDDALASATEFWRKRVASEMTLETPEPWLNNFFKANLWHVLISTDIDPATGLHEHGAATRGYQNFLNETMMVARSLEMRCEHWAAAKLIEPFLVSQGTKGLPGNFRAKTGVFHAAYPADPDPYTALGYNMNHGFGLWGVAEHFIWTKDMNWLRLVANRLALGCNWITAERQATQTSNPDGSRCAEWGLVPAGQLEDVEEYQYYYATDAYYHLGMRKAADALAAMMHPGSARLGRDADNFSDAIRASVAESVAVSPVVRLRDGTYVPCVPSRVHALTHLKEGWIREGLYPALHLVEGGVIPPNHPFAEWMIQDLEDNIFSSAESGYGIAGFETNFFNLGGFTLQPNLLNLAHAYLERDQISNFLRAFYNTAATSLYPDAMCFAEWAPRLGEGGGPLYKTPDECRFVQLIRQMLIMERDDTLELGLGVPRAWMASGQQVKVERAATFFGPLDLELVSRVAENRIEAHA
ncbi:MAG TPA: hypothetical protein VHH73_19160, partial [Verrucomicrobiae bacterium]|nr:hypothetical protein [Verrucomicrobiae bacterium]